MKMFLQIDINMFSCSIFQTDIVFWQRSFPIYFTLVIIKEPEMSVNRIEIWLLMILSFLVMKNWVVFLFLYIFLYRKVWQVLHFQHIHMYTSCIDHTSDIIFWYHSSVKRSYRYYYFSFFFFFEKKINLHSLLLIHKLKSTELTSNKELPVKSICNIK